MLESIPAVVEVLAKTSSSSGGGVAAAFLIFFIVFALIVVFYILSCWLLYRIGKKMNYDKCWLAWIPIAQYYMLCELAGKDMTFFIIMLVGSFLCGIVTIVMMVIAWMALAERMGKESWLGVLTIIPFVGFIGMYIIGNGVPVAYPQPMGFAAAPGYPPPQGYAPPPPQGYAPPPPQGYAPPPPQGYAPPPPPPAQPPAAPPPPPPPAGTPPAPGGE